MNPKIVTELPGPKARAIIETDTKYTSPSYGRVYPLVMRRGSGVMVEDVDGNQFLDFQAGIAVCSTGHAHPKVVEAIQRQAADFLHMCSADFYSPVMAELSQRLTATFPGGGPARVFYANSGTEAVEAAMKLSRYHTGRDKFIAFLGSFHGRSMGSLSLTSSKTAQRRRFGALVPGVHHVTYPKAAGETAQTRAAIERLFQTILPPEEVAAIVVEPIQGEGGYIVPPSDFLPTLREIADQHGILLVADEVQCGLGRTGKMWAVEHANVVPDMICSSKGLASGMPLGAMMARGDIMNWTPGAHASTFGGNPVCLAAALATLDLVQGGLMGNAAAMGQRIIDRIAGWPKRFPRVTAVRGLGLMVAIDLAPDGSVPAGDVRDKIIERAFHRGLLLLSCGEAAIRFMPPLVVGADDVDCALTILEGLLA